MTESINKIVVVILVLFLSSTSAFAQQMELNDPQIISVVETVNQIDIIYGEIAIRRSKKYKVKKFAQTMVDDHKKLFNQTLALEKELILSTQTNTISRTLSKQMVETVKILETGKRKYFDAVYLDNAVTFHREAVTIFKDILIPQARNAKLKNFLNKIQPIWVQALETAKEIQIDINK